MAVRNDNMSNIDPEKIEFFFKLSQTVMIAFHLIFKQNGLYLHGFIKEKVSNFLQTFKMIL